MSDKEPRFTNSSANRITLSLCSLFDQLYEIYTFFVLIFSNSIFPYEYVINTIYVAQLTLSIPNVDYL